MLWGHSTPQTLEKDRDMEDMDRDERTCERCEEHVKGRKRFVADGSVRALDYVGLWTFDSEYTNSDSSEAWAVCALACNTGCCQRTEADVGRKA